MNEENLVPDAQPENAAGLPEPGTAAAQSGSTDFGLSIPAGVDPDLIPYLLAAAEEDSEEDEEDTDLTPEELAAQNLEALRTIVKETLLAGADPELIAEIMGEADPDPDFADDEEGAALDPREAALDEAEAESAMHALYQQLLNRAPEHDFDPTLDRTKEVFYILGDPQDSYPSVHVAGTNGKTSTTRLASALLEAFGLRVGTFTSPHLESVRERIQVNGTPVSAAEFLAFWDDVAPYIDMVDAKAKEAGGPQISYFEVLTIMALAGFADVPVDVAVVECGMGGRFDSTNVLDSGVQVITPISLDHQQWLGESLPEIAGEKAAIIKDKSVVVVAKQPAEVLPVLEARCEQTDSVMRLQGRDWEVLDRTPGVGGQMVTVRTPAATYQEMFVPLHGAHQAQNAAAALVAVEAMMGGKALPPEVVEAGFLQARSPGRLEVVRRSPTVLVDAAHNPAGVAVMREALVETFPSSYLVGVFTAMADKNIEAMLVEAEQILEQLVITVLPGDRAADADQLKEIAEDVFGEDRVHLVEELPEAIDKAVELSDRPTDPSLQRAVVVFGSIYLAGAATTLMRM